MVKKQDIFIILEKNPASPVGVPVMHNGNVAVFDGGEAAINAVVRLSRRYKYIE